MGHRLTPASQSDLSSIWDFTRDRWDIQRTELYVLEIRDAIERITADPDRGRSCDEIRLRYRRYPVGSHLLFYMARDGMIEVVRMLHQRMDPTLHLEHWWPRCSKAQLGHVNVTTCGRRGTLRAREAQSAAFTLLR